MPLGFQRLNERVQRPNPHINFIKPLPGPTAATAEHILNRVAASCTPVMARHHLSVMALEEHAANAEFLGRNFNAGEVVQLVLRDRRGRWLPLRAVQLVMLHELAHCQHMNHGKGFWAARNGFAAEMEPMWRGGYTGEGMWGRGMALGRGEWVVNEGEEGVDVPETLCGGSFRRRGRKRKRGRGQEREDGGKVRESYAERQQRRIARKFGVHGDGVTVGEDDLLRGALETMNGGKRSYGKPRVANSKRGRELRANAALARFGQVKEESKDVQVKQEPESDSETEWEEEDANGVDGESVVIKDERGGDLVRVCGGEEEEDKDAGDERKTLALLTGGTNNTSGKEHDNVGGPIEEPNGLEDSETEDEADVPALLRTDPDNLNDKNDVPNENAPATEQDAAELEEDRPPDPSFGAIAEESGPNTTCAVCSLENDVGAATCMACAHVLKPRLVPDSWHCTKTECAKTNYLNAGDAGRCGLCGASKPAAPAAPVAKPQSRAVGVTSADVLRWD